MNIYLQDFATAESSEPLTFEDGMEMAQEQFALESLFKDLDTFTGAMGLISADMNDATVEALSIALNAPTSAITVLGTAEGVKDIATKVKDAVLKAIKAFSDWIKKNWNRMRRNLFDSSDKSIKKLETVPKNSNRPFDDLTNEEIDDLGHHPMAPAAIAFAFSRIKEVGEDLAFDGIDYDFIKGSADLRYIVKGNDSITIAVPKDVIIDITEVTKAMRDFKDNMEDPTVIKAKIDDLYKRAMEAESDKVSDELLHEWKHTKRKMSELKKYTTILLSFNSLTFKALGILAKR